MNQETKPEPPPPVKAEVIDHFISLHMGENAYKVFRKGAIVEGRCPSMKDTTDNNNGSTAPPVSAPKSLAYIGELGRTIAELRKQLDQACEERDNFAQAFMNLYDHAGATVERLLEPLIEKHAVNGKLVPVPSAEAVTA